MEQHSAELHRAISQLSLKAQVVADGQIPRDDVHFLSPGSVTPLAPPSTPATMLPSPPEPTHHDMPILTAAAAPSASPTHGSPDMDQETRPVENTVPKDSANDSPEDHSSAQPEEKQQGKKKKRSKKSGKKRKPAPTGFEEYYVDGPITPQVAAQELGLYAADVPFASRIETAIQRYRATRKLDEIRLHALTKYLMLGGVDAGSSKSFVNTTDSDELDQATADEIRELKATDYIRNGSSNAKFYDPERPEHWVVDFTGIVQGFLSYRVFQHFDMHREEILKKVIAVPRNFLTYLLARDVCPEHSADIMEARRMCDVAELEIPKVLFLQRHLPGKYNIAASCLYGGRYSPRQVDESADFLFENVGDLSSLDWQPISAQQANEIFQAGLQMSATNEQRRDILKGRGKLACTEELALEVIATHPGPTRKNSEAILGGVPQSSNGSGESLGRMVCKLWSGPGIIPEDATDSESDETDDANPRIITLWLESSLLEYCFVGMKFQATVRHLDVGLTYFDQIDGVYCSFFTYLPNEKLATWKEPVPNDRPAPSVDDIAEDLDDDDG